MLYNIVFKPIFAIGAYWIKVVNLKTYFNQSSMKYISISSSSISVFTARGELSELGGSSKYRVDNGVIDLKVKRKIGKIENRGSLLDLLQFELKEGKADEIQRMIAINYMRLWTIKNKGTKLNEKDEKRLNEMGLLLSLSYRFGSDFLLKSKIINKNITQENCRYKQQIRIKKEGRKLNKSKIKGKMSALFNLKCSAKFIAFYSVGFPANISDNEAFVCWNYWLTCLRKRFNLTNYVWVSERQKNGTLHYHMLTNNYMPIKSINRCMAIIINNRVLAGSVSWGNSSLEKYNGVDVDSVWGSKRHKKTGKALNPVQLRQWIGAYLTKYVSKNNETFSHLCWHCSRSVSILFTSTLQLYEHRQSITNWLPTDVKKYYKVISDFNTTCVFLFTPHQIIYDKIKSYNDLIFGDYEPFRERKTMKINLKATTL
jgi:hypothetical protein